MLIGHVKNTHYSNIITIEADGFTWQTFGNKKKVRVTILTLQIFVLEKHFPHSDYNSTLRGHEWVSLIHPIVARTSHSKIECTSGL